jgi:hypothetical protein
VDKLIGNVGGYWIGYSKGTQSINTETTTKQALKSDYSQLFDVRG